MGLIQSFFSYSTLGDLMRKMLAIFVILFLIFPINVNTVSTSATSAILMDMDSGRILYSKDIHKVRSVASISKIMTAVVAIESGKLDDIVTIGEEIDKSYGSGVYIQKGEKITLRDLVYGLMLRSGNDAADAIAYYLGKDKFVDMMNSKARELGMKNTTFNNPSGLDEDSGNFSTVYDMALLTSHAMKLVDYQEIVNTKTHRVETNKNTYIWKNKHKLLYNYQFTTGGKTGFTGKAKRTLVTTASKNGLNLVVVTLNDGNDYLDHMSLFNYGFLEYQNVKVLTKGSLNLYDELYYGNYHISIDNNYSYPVREDEELLIKYELSDEPEEGDVGYARVYLNDEEIHRETIKAVKLEAYHQGLIDWFKSLW